MAPPISSGMLLPRNQSSRSISLATNAISSSDGVISPDSPTMSAPSSRALARMSLHGTMTPMLTTSKLLHWRTTVTMFLPMSWTSPLTVAMTILPRARMSPPLAAICFFSSSMYGIRWATALFMTRADS